MPFKYLKSFLDAGGNLANVTRWTSHYLYGTDPNTLAKLSRQGIVYNPPGH